MVAIGRLEKNVRRWVERDYPQRPCGGSDGWDVDVEVFRTGPGGDQHYGPSHVEVTVTRYVYRENEDGLLYEDFDASATVKFLANDFGSIDDPQGLGGVGVNWSRMKVAAMAHMAKELGHD